MTTRPPSSLHCVGEWHDRAALQPAQRRPTARLSSALARMAPVLLAATACIVVAPYSAAAQAVARPSPDLVLVRGHVFTADPAQPWAEALAIRGDRIIAVGTSASIGALAGPHTRRIQLGGRTVIPGFNDAHVHLGAPLPGVAFRTSTDPVPDPSLPQVLDSLTRLVARVPAGTWLHTEIDAAILDDTRARRTVLDSVAPAHPVWLAAGTGHGIVVNSAGLRALGIADDAADPAGGFYERDGIAYPGRGSGRITGLLHEYAGWNADRRLRSQQPDSALVTAFRRHAEQALRLGITSVQDMANALDPGTTFRVLRLARLPIRVRVIAMPATDVEGRRTGEWPLAAGDTLVASGTNSSPRAAGTRSATKWILDGTGIERLSLLRAPYADRPQWSGMLNFSIDTMRALLREALAAGEQPVLHAIGDSTIVLALDAMQSVAPDSVWRAVRPRLEHAEWLTPALRVRAARLGVVVVENPTHFTDGPVRMRARFGDTRPADYQPLRSLLTFGIPLAIGSDGPLDPFLNLMFAVTHPDNPSEAITREATVSAYTRGSAFAECAEHVKGTIAPGMLADIAVLSQDVFTVPTDSLPGTVSVVTVVGGRIAYDAGVLVPRPRDLRRARPSHRGVNEVPAGLGSPAQTAGRAAREAHRRRGGRAVARAPLLASGRGPAPILSAPRLTILSRLKDGITPSRSKVASSVAPFIGLPLSACSTRPAGETACS